MVEIAREVCGSVRAGGKNSKSVCQNDMVRAAVRRKEVFAANEEEAKERCKEKVYTSDQKESKGRVWKEDE